MGRFDFSSPSAEAVEGITGILARRKAEERQALLDQLQVNADQRAAQEVQAQNEMRQATMAQMAQNQELQRYGHITANLDYGADASKSGLSPDDIELVGRLGGWKYSTPTPSPNGPVTDASGASDAVASLPAPSRSFVGTPQQRER